MGLASCCPATYHDIVVIGAGCIGQGLTASLLLSNPANRIFLLCSKPSLQKIQGRGIHIEGCIQGVFKPSERLIVLEQLTQHTLQHYAINRHPTIFLATKTYAVLNSLHRIKEALYHLKPALLCLQNGLGTEQLVKTATYLFDVPVLKSQIFSALHRRGEAIFSYPGRLIVEHYPGIDRQLSVLFGQTNQGLFQLEMATDILMAIYPKLVVNCVCNPLTVIFNKNLGFLRHHYEALIRAICQELRQLALVLGLSFSFSQELPDLVLTTMENYAEHHSSMHMDIDQNRPTEIDAINGAILRLAHERGIKMPLNTMMYQALKHLERLRQRHADTRSFYQQEKYALNKIAAKLLYASCKKEKNSLRH